MYSYEMIVIKFHSTIGNDIQIHQNYFFEVVILVVATIVMLFYMLTLYRLIWTLMKFGK